MTAPFSPAFLVNDPEHSPFGASWLRGITPVRVAVFVAVCSMIAIDDSYPSYLRSGYSSALGVVWDRFGRALACATPMFILIIKTEGWTAQSSPRWRVDALVVAVVVGAVSYAALRTGVRFLHGTVTSSALPWEDILSHFVRALLAGGVLTAILHFAARGWTREITPLRLAILAAVCLVLAAHGPLWDISPDHLFRPLRGFVITWMEYFLCALPIFVLVVQAEARTARSTLRIRVASLALAVAIGALAFPVGNAAFRTLWLNFIPGQQLAWQSWHYMLAFYIKALSTGGLLSAILLFAAQQREAERRISQARLARVEIERQMAESRLQLLQAQIEPHFLFNSLASVKRLHEKEPGGGRALLRNLRDYLRAASLAGERREVRLGDEIVLARSFLSIFQVRMGDRLRVRIDVPANLESALIPPLMVGTLTENAIKHGIGPRAAGGTVVFAARSSQGILEVDVADDGVGFRARTGHGVGLANTRARLETLYGGDGSLDLVANTAGGVTATIRIPHRSAMQAPAAP